MVLVPWQLLAVNLAARLTGAEDKKLHLFVWLAVVLALPIVAAIAYHLVEHPARKALRGLADRRAARAALRRDAPQVA
jgi:peptidoglycan/LPS O-acetylase OafA/YrhL